MNVQCPAVGLYWPIYLLEVNSSIQYRQTLQSRLCLMILDWNTLLLLPWMYVWHISFMSTWRPWWTCIRASPKRWSCDVLLCRYVLILRKALKDCSASALPAGSVQPMHRSCLAFGNWSSSACWRCPGKLTEVTLCRLLLPVGNPLLQLCNASQPELVDLPRTSCSCDAISCRLDFSFRRLTGTRLNLQLSKLVEVWDWYGTKMNIAWPASRQPS